MAITNPNASDQLDAALANGQQFSISKPGGTGKGAGTFHSMWKVSGTPLPGANPPVGAGGIPTRQTMGAIPLAPFGANTCYLGKITMTPSVASTLFLGDRLFHCSGLNGTLTTVQNINSSPINRNVGKPNLLFVEFYTPTGATASNLTINFTNTAGVAKTQVFAFPTSPLANQMVWAPFNDSVGVQSLQNIQLSVSTGTVGDFGFTIVNQIELLPLSTPNLAARYGVYDMAIPQIETDACLFFYQQLTGNSFSQILGNIAFGMG